VGYNISGYTGTVYVKISTGFDKIGTFVVKYYDIAEVAS
jgi:hypothetical protein